MNKQVQKKILNFIMLIIGCLFLATLVNLLLLPNDLVTGGMTGIAIILNDVLGINPAHFILLASILTLIMSYFTLGKERTSKMAVGALLWPVLLNITTPFFANIHVTRNDLLLVAIFAGIIGGIGIGLINKAGYSTGGGEAITLTISKYFNVSFGKAAMFVDGSIIIAGGIVFGPTKVLYALVIMYITAKIADRIILGISRNKVFYIMTTKTKDVRKYIEEELGYDITIFDVESGFFKRTNDLLMSAIATGDYFRLKEGIKEIDPYAFIMILDEFQHGERPDKVKHEQKIKCLEEEVTL